LALTLTQRPTLKAWGGCSAAEATLEPHGGEWLPRRGTGRGIKMRR